MSEMSLFADFINSIGASVVTCPRCGQPCLARESDNDEARLLKHTADMSVGLCGNCAVQEFLMSVETLKYAIEKQGPQILLWDAFQEQFVEIMKVGFADMNPAEINWELIVENWELSFPERKKRRKGRRP